MKDIEIAQQVTPAPITEIAAKAGLTANDIDQYGSAKAKVKLPLPRKTTTVSYTHLTLPTKA